MLALQPQRQEGDLCVPNILPCRIHHNGPTKVTKRYWAPSTERDGTKTSYFRGRRLRGRTTKLPSGYIGVTAQATDRLLPQQARPLSSGLEAEDAASDAEDDYLNDTPEPVKILQATATFNELTTWGHDTLPALDDPFVKGIEEWIAFAEAIHGQPGQSEPQTASTTGQGTNA